MSVTVELLTVGSCRERAWFVHGRGRRGTLRFPALVARIVHPRLGVILFDTGYGRALETSRTFAARLYRRLLPFSLPDAERLTGPADLIFLSHFHPDHLGGLAELPPAPILHDAAALASLQQDSPLRRLRAAFLPELLPPDFAARARPLAHLPRIPLPFAPFPHGYDLAGDSTLLAIPLPGHARGQHGLLCRLADGRRLFLLADAAWSIENITVPTTPPWLIRRLVDNGRALVETLERLRALHRDHPEILLLPTHCEPSLEAFRHGR